MKIWRILLSRCKNESDDTLALLIIKMYHESRVIIGSRSISADVGVVQGGVLCPMLFNVYLEETLGETQKLRDMVNRGDLLAFAEHILILTNSKAEMAQAIQELESLSGVWNLRLNKAKS